MSRYDTNAIQFAKIAKNYLNFHVCPFLCQKVWNRPLGTRHLDSSGAMLRTNSPSKTEMLSAQRCHTCNARWTANLASARWSVELAVATNKCAMRFETLITSKKQKKNVCPNFMNFIICTIKLNLLGAFNSKSLRQHPQRPRQPERNLHLRCEMQLGIRSTLRAKTWKMIKNRKRMIFIILTNAYSKMNGFCRLNSNFAWSGTHNNNKNEFRLLRNFNTCIYAAKCRWRVRGSLPEPKIWKKRKRKFERTWDSLISTIHASKWILFMRRISISQPGNSYNHLQRAVNRQPCFRAKDL